MKRETFLIKQSTVNDKEYTLEAVFSNEKEDRHGDVVKQEWDLKSFRKNPVLLNSHNYGDATEVIGRISKIKSKDKELTGKVHFAVNENPKAKIVFDLYAGGFLNGFSVGFIPKKFDDDDFSIIEEAELLEISAVSVPANAFALAKSKGIEVDKLYKDKEELKKQETEEEIKEEIEENPNDEEIKDEEPEEGSEKEYRCELKDPKDFEKFFRREKYKKVGDKELDYIFGIKSNNKIEIQSIAYPTNQWTESEARNHSKEMGKFIPSTKFFGQDTWDDTGDMIRLKVRDIDEFVKGTFEKVNVKNEIPKIIGIVAQLKGADYKLLQSLTFPKEDGWTLDDSKKWFVNRQMEILNLIPKKVEEKGCKKTKKPKKSITEVIRGLSEKIEVETRLTDDRAKKKRIINEGIRKLIKAKKYL